MFATATLAVAILQTAAPQAHVMLVPSVTSVQPGRPFQVAVHLTMPRGWHSYYANPGESGMATKITWRLPKGFKAGPIHWPKPDRLMIDGIAAFGYEHEAWLVTDITPPDQRWGTAGNSTIEAKVQWLLCQEACFPQSATVTVPIRMSMEPTANPLFLPAQRSLPKQGDGFGITGFAAHGQVSLVVPRNEFAQPPFEVYPSDPTYFGADLPKVERRKKVTEIQIPLSRYAPHLPNRFTGILVMKGVPVWLDFELMKR